MNNFQEGFEIVGQGPTKKEAILQAISQIRDIILKQYPDDIVLHIKPVDVKILKSDLTQAGLMKKEAMVVSTKITVDISLLKID